MITELSEFIFENWNTWYPDSPKPSDLIFIKLNSRDTEFGTISMLILSQNNEPIFYLKIAKNVHSFQCIITRMSVYI